MKKLKERKLNDNGFSLVELIIVIAIMAVLVGVLAPQYLKYVERSRKSTDCQNVDAIISALEVYAADPTVASGDALTTGFAITLTTTSTSVTGGEGGNCTNNADKALTNAGITSLQLKSSKWSATTIEITGTINDDGSIKFDATDKNILTGDIGTTTTGGNNDDENSNG